VSLVISIVSCTIFLFMESSGSVDIFSSFIITYDSTGNSIHFLHTITVDSCQNINESLRDGWISWWVIRLHSIDSNNDNNKNNNNNNNRENLRACCMQATHMD
jgi:hypothetical protein